MTQTKCMDENKEVRIEWKNMLDYVQYLSKKLVLSPALKALNADTV